MYDHWFATLDINPTDWNRCAKTLRNNLPSALQDAEYDELKAKLAKIDTSDERRKAEDAVKEKVPDYLQQEFLGYIDTDLMPIKYNQKKIFYKEWFTFKIISQNGNPGRLECGADVAGHGYRVRYRYDSNEVDVNTWDSNHNEIYLMDITKLPDKIQPFVLSLFRYLRKAYNKSEPKWVDRSN